MATRPGDLAHKFITAREHARPFLTQRTLASRLGVSPSLISMVESGDREPKTDLVLKAAEVLGIPDEWWFDGKEGAPPQMSAPSDRTDRAHIEAIPWVGRRRFPLVGSAGAAALPLTSADVWPGDYIEFSDDLYRPERFAITVRGDSMRPRFEHGDFVLVQPSRNVEKGLIGIAHNAEYEYVTKVMGRTENGRAELLPVNQEYEPIFTEAGWEIVGYAVGWRRERGPGAYIEEGNNAGLRP